MHGCVMGSLMFVRPVVGGSWWLGWMFLVDAVGPSGPVEPQGPQRAGGEGQASAR
jgi:hypothetical protein